MVAVARDIKKCISMATLYSRGIRLDSYSRLNSIRQVMASRIGSDIIRQVLPRNKHFVFRNSLANNRRENVQILIIFKIWESSITCSFSSIVSAKVSLSSSAAERCSAI